MPEAALRATPNSAQPQGEHQPSPIAVERQTQPHSGYRCLADEVPSCRIGPDAAFVVSPRGRIRKCVESADPQYRRRSELIGHRHRSRMRIQVLLRNQSDNLVAFASPGALDGKPVWLTAIRGVDEAEEFINRLGEDLGGPYFASFEKGIVLGVGAWAAVT